ncbi:MAG: HEAT repeat domain-containing protein [Planctomycetota bacterium]
MKIRTLACAAVASAMLAIAGDLSAHGGTYRGPGDTVPPNSGSGSGKTGNPGTPSTPTPGTPSTPTPGTPSTPTSGGPTTPTAPTAPTGGGGRQGATTGGGYTLEADLTKWEFWWEFNKDPFLDLKSKVFAGAVTSGSDDFELGRGRKSNTTSTLAPNDTDKKQVIETLKKQLQDPSSNRDIVSSCLMALAKIGGDTSVIPMFKKFLPDADQEKRETAALALGITALKEVVPDLTALALDNDEGRKLVAKNSVDYRTRSFSCYGLGLVANRNHDLALQRQVFQTMKAVLENGNNARRDEKVAALNAIRLLQLEDAGEEYTKLRDEVVAYLLDYLGREKDETDLVRSHSLTALGTLVGRNGDEKGELKETLVKLLNNRKEKSYIHQSAVIALGLMAKPEDEDACKALQSYLSKGRDPNARNFAAISLGQIGGESNKAYLYKTFTTSRTQDLVRPWLAFGLAIMDKHAREADINLDVDRTSADAIHREFRNMRNKSFAAGLALALGVMQYKDAALDIEKVLQETNEEEPQGYLCVSLGLLENAESKDMINKIVEGATRRDQLLTQAAIALGLLGDKEISRKLTKRLEQDNVVAVYSAIATALGWIGDRYSISPLVQLAENKAQKDLPRAFACVALGLIADKEPLPWNSKIAINANYRANVETLTSEGTGILDIL